MLTMTDFNVVGSLALGLVILAIIFFYKEWRDNEFWRRQAEENKREAEENKREAEENKREAEEIKRQADERIRKMEEELQAAKIKEMNTPGLSVEKLPAVTAPVVPWVEMFLKTPYDTKAGPGGKSFCDWLTNAVDCCNAPEFHSPTFAIVQASGCGKSRLVSEGARYNPFLYFCCAPAWKKCVPSPMRNSYVRRFLRLDDLEMAEGGELFLQRLCTLGSRYRTANPAATSHEWFNVQAFQHEELASYCMDDIVDSSSLNDAVRDYRQLWGMDDQVPLAVILDEAGALFKSGTAAFRSVRRAVRSVWQEPIASKRQKLCLVLLDTHSRVSNLSPLQHQDPSLRPDGTSGFQLYPPLWFTCNPLGTFLTTSCTLDVATSLSELACLGRPLWKTAYRLFADDCIMKVAMPKFYCGELADTLVGERRKLVALSSLILSCGIAFTPKRETAEELTASNMVFLELIEPDRETLWLRSVSEPILAMAALNHLKKNFAETLSLVRSQIDYGLKTKGEFGELIARALLLKARASIPLLDQSKLKYCRPVNVATLLLQLLPAAALDTLRDHIENDVLCRFQAAFCHAICASSEVTAGLLLAALRSNAIISGRDNQPAWDICIPITDAGPTDLLTTATVSGIFIQVKNQASLKRDVGYSKDAADIYDRCTLAPSIQIPPGPTLLRAIKVMMKLDHFLESSTFRRPPVLILFQMQWAADEYWCGRSPEGDALWLIFNPIYSDHLQSDEKEACARFAADPVQDSSLRIFRDTVNKYQLDAGIASFAEKMIQNINTPLETRAAALHLETSIPKKIKPPPAPL